jgi:hypothetical protein
VDQTLALLVADDPQGQARKLLDHVVARCEAKTGAVVTVAGGDLGSFAGEVPLSHLAALQRLWMAEERLGRPPAGRRQPPSCLIDDKELSGLLFVEGGNSTERNTAVVALTATSVARRSGPSIGLQRSRRASAPRPSGGGCRPPSTATSGTSPAWPGSPV